ncbi:MAG: 16S rRNA (adenine(1518)-N(6)/adenine(1519)-N(6))-dimethyltransferase RsmA [Patescibacteria group bacterium]
MNLYSAKAIQVILEDYNLKPQKKMGQNFLIDKNIIAKFITTCDLNENDTVIEIGSGLGSITQFLAEKAGEVIGVEKDPELVKASKEILKDFENIKIIQDDILNFNTHNLKKYKIVGNLPFYITSPIIKKFLEEPNKPEKMVFIIQKEVAQRICSTPPDMTILSNSVQFFAQPKIISLISKNSFWPVPTIDSAILEVSMLSKNVLEQQRETLAPEFFKIMKAGFSHPRKQLANNFSQELNLDKKQISKLLNKGKIEGSRRAESLKIQDWINLAKSLKYINE